MKLTRLKRIIERDMVQYGVGILLISYGFFLWFIWTAHFSSYQVTLNFNHYGEGIYELIAMTAGIVPVGYVIKNFKRLYPEQKRRR